MGIARYVTVAGKTIFEKIACERPKKIPGQKRIKKQNPTPEAVRKINEKNAIRDLAAILNHNFHPGDLHLVLTYAGEPPDPEEAKKHLSRFERKMNEAYKKAGIIFKRVSVTEYHNKRIHHHIVCTAGASPKVILSLWKHGFVYPVLLDETGDYRKLAEYLIKETRKHFRDPDAISKRRYNCSRSIERPETKKEEVSFLTYKKAIEKPRARKGYYIDQDTYYRGTDPVTGHDYVEYVQIALDEEPRIKKYKKGKRVKNKNPYNTWLEKNEDLQLEFPEMNITNAVYAIGGLITMANSLRKK